MPPGVALEEISCDAALSAIHRADRPVWRMPESFRRLKDSKSERVFQQLLAMKNFMQLTVSLSSRIASAQTLLKKDMREKSVLSHRLNRTFCSKKFKC